jgi:hypothetical protein
MFKTFNSRFKIQELCEGHWLAHDVLNSTYKLKDFIHIVECLYFYNKRGCKYRVFDYELGKVVYE